VHHFCVILTVEVRMILYDVPSQYPYVDVSGLVVDKKTGYLYFCDADHPLGTGAAGRVLYHRHVASVGIGRWVVRHEVVHHENDDRLDNDPLNLVVTNRSDHAKLHKAKSGNMRLAKKCERCGGVFVPTGGVGRFCSTVCGNVSSRRFDVSYEELQDLVWLKPLTKIAEMFGVSDVAVLKRCRTIGVSRPPQGHWSKKENRKG